MLSTITKFLSFHVSLHVHSNNNVRICLVLFQLLLLSDCLRCFGFGTITHIHTNSKSNHNSQSYWLERLYSGTKMVSLRSDYNSISNWFRSQISFIREQKIHLSFGMSRFRYIICFAPASISRDNLPILYRNKYKMGKSMIN